MLQSNNNNNNKQSEVRVAPCAAQVKTEDHPTGEDEHEPTKDEPTGEYKRSSHKWRGKR